MTWILCHYLKKTVFSETWYIKLIYQVSDARNLLMLLPPLPLSLSLQVSLHKSYNIANNTCELSHDYFLPPVKATHCAHWKQVSYSLSFYLQGHSTLRASQDFSTLLTWMAGTNSQRTVNAAATTPRKSKGRIASQVQGRGMGQGKDFWTLRECPWGVLVRISSALCSVVCPYW